MEVKDGQFTNGRRVLILWNHIMRSMNPNELPYTLSNFNTPRFLSFACNAHLQEPYIHTIP
jgi:hypothetical protein